MGSSIPLLRKFTVLLVTGKAMIPHGIMNTELWEERLYPMGFDTWRSLTFSSIYTANTSDSWVLVSWLWLHGWCYWSSQEHKGPGNSPITWVPYKWSSLRHESEKRWGESRWIHAVGISAPDYKLLVKLSDFCHLIIPPKRRYKSRSHLSKHHFNSLFKDRWYFGA